jgi:exodeoxyribonuclease-3
MKILSWNVNSVRLRLSALIRIARRYEPEVICLQETKVEDGLFPLERLERLGFRHHAVKGQKSYNGVAILSKLPLSRVESPHWCRRRDSRHVHATLGRSPGGIEIHNLYVPAGGEIPDPERNPKFAHKLQFFRELTGWFRRKRRNARPIVLVGDLNVAPLPEDVWSHEKLKRVVTHTPVEVEALEQLAASRSWVDAVRHFRPVPRPVFTWWSYRTPEWRRANKGRRLDHVWVSDSLRPGLVAVDVLTNVRGWRQPSDHVPILVEIDT